MPAQPIGDITQSSVPWLEATSDVATQVFGVRVALHQTALLGLSWCDQLAIAQNQHWQRVGILRKTLWKYGVATVARSLRAHRLSASSLSWAGGFTGSLGFSFREAIEDCRQALEEARAIGAETVVIAPGGRAGHTVRHARRLVVDGLKALSDRAADCRLRLAVLVSPPARYAAASHFSADDAALELLDQVGSQVLGLACGLPDGVGHPAALEHWQPIMRRSWVVWLDSEPRTQPLQECLPHLALSGFEGILELRSQACRATSNPRAQREVCRALSEALGLPHPSGPALRQASA